eukprot:419923-Amphidinium_carterae.3
MKLTRLFSAYSISAQASLRAHFVRIPELCGHFAVYDLSKYAASIVANSPHPWGRAKRFRPFRALLEAVRESWTKEMGMPVGNDGGANSNCLRSEYTTSSLGVTLLWWHTECHTQHSCNTHACFLLNRCAAAGDGQAMWESPLDHRVT